MEPSKEDKLYAMRHSMAHILATALQRLHKDAKFGVGPVVENGFYYDIDLGDDKLSEEDFPAIELEMKKIVGENSPFTRSTKPIDEAIAWAKENNQPYKEELLNDLKRSGTTIAKDIDANELGIESSGDSKVEGVSFYTDSGFTDLCRGPHVESTGRVGAFKLMRVSGAYWRGNENNPQMQRVYGVAFNDRKQLQIHLNMLEEAKKRDHRRLGQDMDLFTFSDLVGAGLPLWTPRGTTIRSELDRFVQEMRDEYGFQAVTVPHITKKDLYIKSGHWGKFEDELFKINTREGHEFAMKPMNCPHHTQIYVSQPRSYRDLPIRYRETTMVYRDEQTGELGGLTRVRSITQDDAHIFCREDQITEEALNLWRIIQDFYAKLDLPLTLRLSRRNPASPDSYAGTDEQWQKAEAELSKVIESQNDMTIEEGGIGEAAFYGPKLDFMAKDSLGRQWQVATIQLDFAQPEGLDLTYTDQDGAKKRPVMVHCAVMGSLERFMAILIEHTAGRFPVWLAPEQIRIITLNQSDEITGYADSIISRAKALKLRTSVDNDNESVGKKIRQAELAKVPYVIVVGGKEVETGMVTPRIRQDLSSGADIQPISIEDFLNSVSSEYSSRESKSSLN